MISGVIIIIISLFVRYDFGNKIIIYDFDEQKFVEKGYVALVKPSQTVVRVKNIKHAPDTWYNRGRDRDIYFEQNEPIGA